MFVYLCVCICRALGTMMETLDHNSRRFVEMRESEY